MTTTTKISSGNSISGRMPPVLVEPARASQRFVHTVSEHKKTQAAAREGARTPHFGWVVLALLLGGAALAGLFYLGWKPRQERLAALKQEAEEASHAMPRVIVKQPERAAPTTEILLPGEVQPERETAIYARTAGYLKHWTVDIGDSVSEGQLLAEIDSPEIDMQLEQSRAALKQQEAALEQAKANIETTTAQLGTATASAELAEITNKRYQSMKGTDAVTEQDLSEKETALKTAKAAVSAAKAAIVAAQAAEGVARANIVVAKADVKRLEVLKSFEQIHAPFAGTITERATETGALITAGSATAGAQPLFRVANSDPVRLFVDVPQVYALSIHAGQEAHLVLRELPNAEISGKVTRTTKSIDRAARTLRIEVEVPNKDGRLLPGMYAQVKLTAAHQAPRLVLPGSALVVNSTGTQLALVRDGKIHYQNVTLDGDYGTSFGVVAGLSESDLVVTNPSERLTEGAAVSVSK